MAFQFDWQKEPEYSFLKWFLPTVLAHTPDPEGAEEVTIHDFEVLTSGFTDVHVSIKINGIEVPVDGFFESIENNIEWEAKKAAAAMYHAAGLTRLYPVLEELEERVKELVITEFAQVGIDLPEGR